MVDHALIDNLNLKTRDLATRWKNMVRKNPQLVHYNTLSDEALVGANILLYPVLSKTLDRGWNQSVVGNYFFNLGRERMEDGFPVSEVIFAICIAERIVIEYVMTEVAPENPVRMYQSMGVISQISEFFLKGCFYLTKGFLETVYKKMNVHDKFEEALLKKYFKDDFFFKAE